MTKTSFRIIQVSVSATLIVLVAACSNSGQTDIPDGNTTLGRWGGDSVDSTNSPDLNAPGEQRTEPDTKRPEKCPELESTAPIQAFFSKSCLSTDQCPCSPLDLGTVVKTHLDSATESISVCAMELQDFTVSNALIDAHDRAVEVHIVVDDSYDEAHENIAIDDLITEGLTISSDAPSDHLMHSKFIVIDEFTTVLASSNLTTYDHRSNANNLVVIRSADLAQIFTTQFDAMWKDSSYHDVANPGPHVAAVDGSPIEVYFGPDWTLIERLVTAIEEAETTIHFSIFSFTLFEIKESLLSRCGELEIKGLYDGDQSRDNNSVAAGGWCAGADIRQAVVEPTPGVDPDFGFHKLHHKVLIVDPGQPDGLVITGSANWSFSAATKNDETMAVFTQSAIVSAFEEEFQARFEDAD